MYCVSTYKKLQDNELIKHPLVIFYILWHLNLKRYPVSYSSVPRVELDILKPSSRQRGSSELYGFSPVRSLSTKPGSLWFFTKMVNVVI